MNSFSSIQDAIRNNNLQDGINYQEGYIIEVYAKEPWRIWFNIGNENSWRRFAFVDSGDWDWNWKYRIKNNQIVSYYEYDKKINFLGINDDYKGEFGLDITNKKIIFFGNNELFHIYYDGKKQSSLIYNKITIRNQNNQIIKEIIIYGNKSMQDIINQYNLQNGIDYKDGYIIEIWSSEPQRVKFYEDSNWKYISTKQINNLKKRFKIDNNSIKDFKYSLSELIEINNLEKFIDNNAILNELSFLIPELDISQLEVTNKTNNSVTIKAKESSSLYFGEKKIYYIISNQQNKIIDLNELIKKGIYLTFRDKYPWIIIKDIKNINTNNLIYSNVTATKSIEPIYDKNSKSICFGTTTLFHNLPEKQNMKTPSCKYTKETTINTQITTGLSKTDSEEKSTEQSSSSSVEHNWSFELGVNVHGEAGVWPFAKVSTDINTKVGVGGNYGSSTTNTSSETKTLSNTFDFSDSKTNKYKESSEVELPSQEIEVKPNQKIKVTASLDEVLAQVTLNLKQDIYGEIIAEKISGNNEKFLFRFLTKEIMQKLKQYNLLPQEITINNNDTITFNGKATRSLKQGFDGNIEFHEVN